MIRRAFRRIRALLSLGWRFSLDFPGLWWNLKWNLSLCWHWLCWVSKRKKPAWAPKWSKKEKKESWVPKLWDPIFWAVPESPEDAGDWLGMLRTRFVDGFVALDLKYGDGYELDELHRTVKRFIEYPRGCPIEMHMEDLPYLRELKDMEVAEAAEVLWDFLLNFFIPTPPLPKRRRGKALGEFDLEDFERLANPLEWTIQLLDGLSGVKHAMCDTPNGYCSPPLGPRW